MTALMHRESNRLTLRRARAAPCPPGAPDSPCAPRPSGAPVRLVSGPLAVVFLSSVATLTSFDLLLSVTPRYVAAGAGSAGAGFVTGVLLLGTVVAELSASVLMKRYRYRTLLAFAAVLMGLPTLALLSGGQLVLVLAVSCVRGFGFGLSTVVMGAMAAMLLPPERRGEGLGLYGALDCLPGVVALPTGVWLAGRCGYAVVLILTVATALIPLAAFPKLPHMASPSEPDAGRPMGLLAGLRHGGELQLSLIFAATTVAAGAVVSFLPLAAGASGSVAGVGLLAQALTATISRWWAGRNGDRHGHGRLLVPGLMIASAGMIAMMCLTTPGALIAGMCLFGAGFGISQNATLAIMIDRMPAAGLGIASALWNLAYDAGYGAGPAIFGLVVGHTGYPAAFTLTGVLMLAAVPAARRQHVASMAPRLRSPASRAEDWALVPGVGAGVVSARGAGQPAEEVLPSGGVDFRLVGTQAAVD
jgi:MFS family permease